MSTIQAIITGVCYCLVYLPASNLIKLLRTRGREALITTSRVITLILIARSTRQGTFIDI